MKSLMKKILVIRLTSLGDVIFTRPLVNSLKSSGEFNEIGYLTSEKGLDVIKNNPSVDKLHFLPLKEWKKHPFSNGTLKSFLALIKELRSEKYDIAIDCQQMFKNLFVFGLCGAKRRITFSDARELSILGANEFVTPKAKFRDNNYHIVERNLDFARYLGIKPEIKFSLPPSSESTISKIEELLSKLDSSKKTVVVSPATTWQNKFWGEANWAELIQQLNGKFNIIFTGIDADMPLLQRILSKTEGISYLNLLGKTNLEELAEVFSRANIVISPDSGSAHLAWATGKPYVIAIFTCTPPKRFGPYDETGKKYFAISQNDFCEQENEKIHCQPCFKRKCRLKEGRKNICTKYPKSGKVMEIVDKIFF